MHIGLDVGTSGVKAAAFDAQGHCLGASLRSYDFCCVEGGRRELDPEEIWMSAKEALARAIAQAGGDRVQSITVASLGEAIVPLNSGGKPLYHCVAGTDIRGIEQFDRLVSDVGEEALVQITGQRPSVIYSVSKILWIKENLPEIYASCWKILNVQDYIVFRLSGMCVMDRSIASRTMLYDIRKQDWSDVLLDRTGIDRDLLPDVQPSGSAAGSLLPGIAREIGAGSSVRVILGAHDHICNALGCGVTEPGWAANVTGTTEGLTAVMQGPPNAMGGQNVSFQPYAVPGLYNTILWMNTSGALLKWFVREFSPAEQINFAQLDLQCGKEPSGLLVLPHFSGGTVPGMDPLSKGAIIGLTLSSTRQDIYQALMEAACFELGVILDHAGACGVKTDRLVVCGGGAKSPAWLRIKADILGRELFVSTCEHNGALGCAILGAAACGDHPSVASAAGAMTEIKPAAAPNPRTSAAYAELAALYQTLYGSLADINHSLR